MSDSTYTLVMFGVAMIGVLALMWGEYRERRASEKMKEYKRKIASLEGIGDFVDAIIADNPDRHHDNLGRRILKIIEECGESSEAYLNVTSQSNPKKKTWPDVREELIDAAIVTIDCIFTRAPGEEISDDDLRRQVLATTALKLQKWQDNRSTAATTVDDSV